MHPRQLSIESFTYTLPQERIARYPLAERDASKLLIWKAGKIREDIYRNIATHLPTGSLLVFNNTKVVEARLLFRKPTGGFIEIFCLEPHAQYSDITSAMLQQRKVRWICLVGGAKKWKDGPLVKEITSDGKKILITAHKKEQSGEAYEIELSWDADISFAELLHLAGAIPLPPYLNRVAEEEDKERYQTIYAQHDGSVAAPTAGLHFTPTIFEQLAAKNIAQDFVTLHVGAGTFKPVKAATMAEHEMHAEYIDVNQSLIKNLISHLSGSVIAIGTTSLRTIESLFWLGLKTIINPELKPLDPGLSQWEAYEHETENISAEQALSSLLQWLEKNQMDRLLTKTQIIIAPGYSFRIANALITNFHQPNSTLLLLVAAITGNEWQTIYQYALENDFRFLSYGDGSLLWM